MARRKSVAAKARTRRLYRQRAVFPSLGRRWRVVLTMVEAVVAFSKLKRYRRTLSICENVADVAEPLRHSTEDNSAISTMENGASKDCQDMIVVHDVVRDLVRSICRRINNEKRRKSAKNKAESTPNTQLKSERRCRVQSISFKRRYEGNSCFRKKHIMMNKSSLLSKYHSNDSFRSEHISRCSNRINERYRMNPQFASEFKSSALTKYHSNTEYRRQKISRLLTKYHSNATFRSQHNIRLLSKYHSNAAFRSQHNARLLSKYHFNEQFRMKHNTSLLKKYHSDHAFRSKMIKQAMQNYRNNIDWGRESQKKYQQTRRIIRKYLLCTATYREKHQSNYDLYLQSFRERIKEGPDYVCRVCRVMFFRNQVIPCIESKYINNNQSEERIEEIRSCLNHKCEINSNWVCKFCSEKLKKQRMPNRAIINQLEVGETPIEVNRLNDLERHLIALRLPFMKIVNLISGKIRGRFSQKGTVGPLHCVPADVEDTVTSLPRPVDRSIMIRLQLKRRLKYKAVWEEQWINPNHVRQALLVLKEKHPEYAQIHINEVDENYLVSDGMGKLNFDDAKVARESEADDNDTNERVEENEAATAPLCSGIIEDKPSDNDDQMSEDENDIRTKFNLGTASCLQPIDLNDLSIFDYDAEPMSVAPAEKNKLISLLTDNSIEKMAFPHLFPDGKGTFDEKRTSKLKWKDYCKTRLFSADLRFASDANYIFFLQYLGDLKEAYSGSNIAFRKQLPLTAGQTNDEDNLKYLFKNDMIYRYLKSVRGSPQYWHQRLKDLFSMNRQLGMPTFFVTLSCADMRWKEFIDVMVRHNGQQVKEDYSFEEKAHLVRNNPVLAARMFERRLSLLMNMFIKGNASCLGKVNDWFGRIEMQMRGSPHTHMPLWVEGAPKYIGEGTDKRTIEEIIEFCDKYITTRFPSKEEDAELHEIIRLVQTHCRNHSKSCLKFYMTICRFGFPRPVSRRTMIVMPYSPTTDEDIHEVKIAQKTLRDINICLNEKEKEKVLEWIDFDNILIEHGWTYEKYEWSLTTVYDRPTLIYKREPNARWVNQYNESILRAWNANMDIQYVFDAYACARYLMSYTTKPEREMSLLLEATHKECREGNLTVREEMKKLTGTFFNHRQVSLQEAIFRATSMPLSYSSRGFVFIPSHSNSCRFLKPPDVLKRLDPNDKNIYMANLADKYFDRPDLPEFDICMADFCSKYEVFCNNRIRNNPKTPIQRLKNLNFFVKKRCRRNAIIRFPHFSRDNDAENYFENLLCLYLPIRSRAELKQPYELFYEQGQIYDRHAQRMKSVKDIVCANRKKYEANFTETNEVQSMFDDLSQQMKDDEWSTIIANKERSQTLNKEIDDEENPDFNMFFKPLKNNPTVHLKQSFPSTNEMRPLLESMNDEQQRVFYYVQDWCLRRLHDSNVEPIRLFVTGGAGTGKSHLLKCLHYEATKIFCRKKHLQSDENIDIIHTLITAFTGAAAVNVNGVTIHSAFGISTRKNRLHEPLSCDKLSTYRCKLGSLKLLFIDEISLVPASLWGAVHSRLQQIMARYSNKSSFGNVGIIAIGDFYQCGPVGSASVYTSLLWSDQFECVELSINERQKENRAFKEMLSRIRVKKKTEEISEIDRIALERCHQRYLNHGYSPEAVHLFAKNVDVDRHNNEMLEKLCNNIRSFDEVSNNGRTGINSRKKCSKNSRPPLRLAINARVMITKNISVIDGIANGVTGRIVRFVEDSWKEVSHVVIKCISSRTGRLHRASCQHCREHDTICVVRENDNDDIQNSDSKSGVKQFPLRLSWAMTIHKAQGLTLDELVLSTKDLFGPGMGYTGLSRQTTIEKLFLKDLHLSKLYCDSNVNDVVSRMKRLDTSLIFQDNHHHLNVLFHNIESLQYNLKALSSHCLSKKAHLICLVETWMTDINDDEMVKIDGYQMIHRTRSASFSIDHPLKFQKHGGTAVFVRKDISITNISSSSPVNLECISLELIQQNIVLVVCYRSPQQTKKEFVSNLINLLSAIDPKKRILIVGDLNENSLQSDSRIIDQNLCQLGFINLIENLSTTKDQTSLDCIYTNFMSAKDDRVGVAGSFYSYHKPIYMSFNFSEPLIKITSENRETERKKWHIDSCVESTIPPTSQDGKLKRRVIEKIKESSKKKKTMNLSSQIEERHVQKEKQNPVDLFSELDEINSNSKKRKNVNQMLENLSSFNLYLVKIPGDGNCFFRAVSDQLYNRQNYHMQIRLQAVSEIRNNRDYFAAYLTNDQNIDQLIEKLSEDGEYADHLIMKATANVIKRNIVVHRGDDIPSLIPSSTNTNEQIHLAFDPHIEHYDSVRSLDGSACQLSAGYLRVLD